MNILILKGSPRDRSLSNMLVQHIMDNISYSNVSEVDTTQFKISSCSDCRMCKNTYICKVDDYMLNLYKKIDAADMIIIATPVYFNSFPSDLKRVIDRLQPYFYRNRDGKTSELKEKVGCLVAVGGADSYKTQFEHLNSISKIIFKELNCKQIDLINHAGTDNSKSIDFTLANAFINRYL